MAWEWAPGVVVAIVGSIITWARAGGIADERVSQLQKDLEKHETENAKAREQIEREMRESFERMGQMITRIEVLATEQTAFMKACTKTLEGMAKKLEAHDYQFMTQGQDIAILKAKQ